MTETAPTFTPSPGIPNAAHARFYEALAKETGGAAAPPRSQGQQFHTPATLQQLAKIEKANAPAAAPVAKGPSVATIKEYQANRGKPKPAAPLPHVDGVDNVAKFDVDMRTQFDAEARAKGQPAESGQYSLAEKLIATKRATPLDKQTSAWKADWERKYAAAVADVSAGANPNEAKPAEIVPAGTNAPSPAVNTAVDFVLKNSNAEGMMVSHAIPKELRSGYTLPSGAKIHAETAIRMLADARRDGVPQSVVDAYVRSIK